jgi:hypothetical protein
MLSIQLGIALTKTTKNRDRSNAAGFPGLTLMQPLPRNEPKVDPGANQVSPQEIKAVPTRECREDVADHPGRQATVSKNPNDSKWV